jgi:hypothetical protein
MDVFAGLKDVYDYLVAPIVIGAWWGFKRHIRRFEKLEQRTVEAEKAILVIESQMSDIRKDIDEIKAGINKLVDKLL